MAFLRTSDPATDADERRTPAVAWLAPLASLGILLAALFVLRGEVGPVGYRPLVSAARAIPAAKLVWAGVLTALSYLTLVGYDALALRYVEKRIGVARTTLGSFVSYGMSQMLGFPLVTGGSIRMRFWSTWGLSSAEIAQGTSFVGVTFTVGVIATLGLALLAEHASPVTLGRFPLGSVWPLGIVCLAVVAGYLVWSSLRARRPIRIGPWQFPVPSLGLAVAQVAVGVIDWLIAGAVLFVLLPAGHGLTVPEVLGAFVLAQFFGLVSHVPGGLGVFETSLLALLSPQFATAPLLGVLVAFRVIYYLLPFVLSVIALGVYEIMRQRERLATAGRAAGQLAGTVATRWAPSALPYVLSTTTFVGGCVLLVSGATPPIRSRVAALTAVLPLGVVELSHFAGSLAGIGLVILARAIYRRLDAAYTLTVALLVVGIVASLLKGLDWEEALALGSVLAVVLPSRRAFYRRAALTGDLFTPEWTVAVLAVVAGTIALGLFAHRNAQFSSEMWWQFTERGDAPRFVRASVGIIGALLSLAVLRLLRHAKPEPTHPTAEDLERAAGIAAAAPETSAYLALVGDKSLLFSESRQAFVMYGVSGRSWVSLGDPVGPPEERAEMAWRFREEADRHGGWTVFYEIGADSLPLYIDLGLSLLKLGEQAVVPLRDFSLEGGSRRSLRRTHRELVKAGVTFEVHMPDHSPELLADLRRVSDAWLTTRKTREKGFSLGRFDDAYVRRFPVGIARRGGEIVAFANLWVGAPGEEVSVDLMRYVPAAPSNVMDYVFIELMLWGHAQGFSRFNLGMAPLSGFADHALAPVWHRAGAFLFRHSEHFYNFQGVRHYKSKFSPVWIPRYLASPGGFTLPRVLLNVATLISGGVGGLVSR